MKVLIAGIGNIFLGDDGFGCEVAKRLAGLKWRDGVRVIDYGIRGFDLAYALMDSYERIILIDAVPRGGPPGTVYCIEPDLGESDGIDLQQPVVETHGMDPMKVLAMVKTMGGEPSGIMLVGCEPESFGPESEGRLGLSRRVEAAVDEAVTLIQSLVAGLFECKHESMDAMSEAQRLGVTR